MVLSRTQALLLLLLFLSVLFGAIFLTFVLTKDAVRTELAQSDAACHGPEMAKLVGRLAGGQERDATGM
jgi:hypothetical protein